MTFNGNNIDFPRVVIIKLQDKFKIRQFMNGEHLLFHLMLKQGITQFTLAAGMQEIINSKNVLSLKYQKGIRTSKF